MFAIPMPTLTDHEYNHQSWSAYAEAVRLSGGNPIEIPLTLDDAELFQLIASCQATLLPGSPADVDPIRYAQEAIPECAPADLARERVDLRLLEDAEHTRKPLFAICFGTQMLNVWRGGTLVQDLSILPVNHRAGRSVSIAHPASVASDSLLGALVDASEAPLEDDFLRLPVNSSHHQALAISGEGLRIVARCPQDAVIEAIEGDPSGPYLLGVQWHPERSFEQSSTSRALFARLIAEALRFVALHSTMPTLSLSEIAEHLQPYLSAPDEALLQRLSTYLDLLLKWNARTNLTAIRDPTEIVRRHFGESLFAAQHIGTPATLLDYGSGAGFPGLPIALHRPYIDVTLAESQHKKAIFLREVVRSLGIGTKIWAQRAEDMPPSVVFDCVTLRAVDKMTVSFPAAHRLSSKSLALLTTQSATTSVLADSSSRQIASFAIPCTSEGVLILFESVSRGDHVPRGTSTP